MAPRSLLNDRGALRMLCNEANSNTSTSFGDFQSNGLWQVVLQKGFPENEYLITGESSPESGFKGLDTARVRFFSRKQNALLTQLVLLECPPKCDIKQMEERALASAMRIRSKENTEAVFVVTTFGGCFRPWIILPGASALAPLDHQDKPPGDTSLYVDITKPTSYDKWCSAVAIFKKKSPTISKTPVPAAPAAPSGSSAKPASGTPQTLQNATPTSQAPAVQQPPRASFALFTSNGESPAASQIFQRIMCSACNVNAPTPAVSNYFRAPVCMSCAAHAGQFSLGHVNGNSGPLFNLLQQRDAQEYAQAQIQASGRAFGVVIPSNNQQLQQPQPEQSPEPKAAPTKEEKGKQPEVVSSSSDSNGERPFPRLAHVRISSAVSSWRQKKRIVFCGPANETVVCDPNDWIRRTVGDKVVWTYRRYVTEMDPHTA